MNENFKIPDQSSLFNIKNLYNQFIEHIGNDGFENIIINPDMSKLLIDSSNDQQKAGWEFENVSIPWGSHYYGLSAGSYIRQDICPKLDDNVYTVTLDIKITENLVMQLHGHQVGINHYEPSIIDLDNPTPENPIQGLFKTIEPRFDEFGDPIRFQVAFSFSASNIPYPLRTTWLSFYRDTDDVDVKFYNVSITKGMFAVNMDKKQCFFTDYVKYNIFDKTYEVSMDGGENYYRLFTSRPEDVDEIVNILVTNDIIYTASDCDLMFLRKDIPDAAERLITFLEGLKSEQDVNLDEAAKLILDGGEIIVNNAQTGTPDKFFSLMVTRGFERDVGIRYNETIDRWQFTHDGIDWKILGSGTGGDSGTGTGSSELEYYAEILDRSGFKYGYYDLFDEVDQADSVINYNDNLNWSGDYSLYKVEDNPTGPWILTTRNVWNPDHVGNTYTFFAHCLTNKPDNAGIIASYSLVGSGGGEPLLENDPGWNSFNLNEFVSPTVNIDELYFRFELTSDDIEFHSFGLFYGVWDYTMGSYTRLREYYVSPNDQGFNASIQVPNGASYTVGEKALELYVNRVRQILDTDYHETDSTHVEMLVPINAGDVVEFYEKFGYADFSESNENALNAHIADNDAHWDSTEMASFSNHIADTSIHFASTPYDDHIADTSIHFVSTPYDNHIADMVNPHGVTIAQIGAADVNHNHDSDYLGLHATADDSNQLNGQLASYYSVDGHTHVSADITDLNNTIQANVFGLGINQLWQDETSSRALNTSYQNTNGKPIAIKLGVTITEAGTLVLQVSDDNITFVNMPNFDSIVPDNHYCQLLDTSSTTPATIDSWIELK